MADEPIASRVANALINDVSLNAAGRAYSTYGTWGILNATLNEFRKASGGLWVGGRISLYQDRISFRPNGLNTAIQEGEMEIDIALGNIKGTAIRRGFLTDIGDVTWVDNRESIFSFRCYNIRDSLKQIERERSLVG